MGSSSRGFVSWGLVGLSIVALAGCGGGGGGGSDDGDGGSDSATEIKAGAFNTTITYPDSDNEVAGVAFVSPTGRFASVVVRTSVYSGGQLNFDSSGKVSGPVQDVAYSTGEKKWVTNTGSLEGQVNSSSNMVLTGRGVEFESQIEFKRESYLSDRGVKFSQMAGVYSMAETTGGTVTLTVYEDGELDGSDETKCQFNGQVTIPNTSVNSYEVDFTVTQCQDDSRGVKGSLRNGTYSGVGSLIPDDAGGTLSFGSSDGEVALIFVGGRGTNN
ncbi:hypothetical protein RE428_33290 [Marinobacter nanhaiticus D15-8W]|uniref:Uncharacterized protein n=1 Tax=Marinobacter nanhaiticus D15-8W TaxID=626887 RepID=N6W1V8_9GAMM|nr:hypothetical protein [Marinobacter nanhaiticus]ENO16520.1 hypothetical protein J057_02380 [Marinobacter nanhaiticus D15-8W]BES72311.1 hypothetical protein RE428_33290 [Marinobacter nanhaiticus D15-8W]